MPTTSGTTPAAMRPLPRWCQDAMLAGVVVFLCWGAAIAYWRTTRSAPGTGELAIYLLGVPSLLALALLVAGRIVGDKPRGRRSAASPPVAPAAPAAPADKAMDEAMNEAMNEAAAARQPAATLAILATALRTAHGASAQALASSIAAGGARADLDPELVDDDGFPVMSVRSPAARDEALQDEIGAWLARNGMADPRFGVEQWRALVLGTAVLEELVGRAAQLLLANADADADPEAAAAPQPRLAPLLRVAPLLPADWTAEHRDAARSWFEHAAGRCGWPAAHVALLAETVPAPAATAPAALFDRLARAAGGADAAAGAVSVTDAVDDTGAGAGADATLAVLVLACASRIGAATVERWCANGTLCTAAHPQGAIPGEGAAGLLLTDVAQARACGAAFALLAPVPETRRAACADDARRTQADALAAAARLALAALPPTRASAAPNVRCVVADTGHRSRRVRELMGCVAETLPRLDEVDDVVRVGEACGDCDAVPFVAALALASHCALDGAAAVLCLANEDPHRCRSALVLPSGRARPG
ncbi:hypothetical protein [uncultured Massilia sp.]|uniref:hypothetical protein n=1 Tax=uncultured Massilia sp. TaxID=169973 RepID=UPI0025F1E901|nr:hypothetical protein [uncultured Massilia sp.]